MRIEKVHLIRLIWLLSICLLISQTVGDTGDTSDQTCKFKELLSDIK